MATRNPITGDTLISRPVENENNYIQIFGEKTKEQYVPPTVDTAEIQKVEVKTKEQYIQEHFPNVEPGANPVGAQILVQLRTVKSKVGMIYLPDETKDFNNGNTQIGRVVKMGQIAFRNRETGELWTEGAWAQVGDIVVMPRWGGFRFEVPIPDTDDKAIFCVYDDVNVKLIVNSNFEAFDKIL